MADHEHIEAFDDKRARRPTVADGMYYCSTCGLVQPLGSFRIACRGCGASGLRGFGDLPRRVNCPVEGCDWTGWDDGEVNDDLKRHLRIAHDSRIEPEWRVAERARVAHLKLGTGTRSWSAACGQYLRSQGRTGAPDDRRCTRCERRANGHAIAPPKSDENGRGDS